MAIRADAGHVLRVVTLCAIASAARAQDSSLESEVERYLEATKTKPGQAVAMRTHWRRGLHMTSANEEFAIDYNARIYVDLGWSGASDFDASETPNEFRIRSARLGIFGHAYRGVLFKLQVEFADSDPDLKDAYVGLRHPGRGLKVLAGHQHEPFGLEQLTSSANTLFMERSSATSAFAPGRNSGILFSNNAAFHLPERPLPSILQGPTRVTWAAGVFTTTDDSGFSADGDASGTVRLAWTIDVNREKHVLVHGAVAYTYRGDDTVRYSDRNGFVDTGDMSVSASQRLSLEFTWVRRGFTLAAEYFYTFDGQTNGPDTNFHGGYAKIGYWLSGEDQGWVFDRFVTTLPGRDFFDGSGGKGSFWIGYRFDALDLDDGQVRGGRQRAHTIGGIWGWNANARVLLNYVFRDVRDGPRGSGEVHLLTLRVQVNF
ncbi:MAG: OprO/OprP family phosphate-selective porin [Planctomycetota bacterium]